MPARSRRARTSVRRIEAADFASCRPIHAVWEITLACDLQCTHCGSRAGKRRPDELTTEECLDVVRQLARLGVREVTLIGGEAYLRKDWTAIIREIASHGMLPTLQTGGRNLTPDRVRAAAEAGLANAGVSLDGLEPLHDRLRGVPGSFRAAVRALELLRDAGVRTSVNTQIGAQTIADLPAIMELAIDRGALNWQLQLTVAMGNAADRPELLLQPYQLRELMPLLATLAERGRERDFLVQAGNNIGYFGPYEHVLRGAATNENIHWTGCNAGQNTIGLEADGTIKGCPSLPTAAYGGGNVRDLSIEQIWRRAPQLAFTRDRSTDDLWGYCKGCYYADTCRAGCSWTTHVLFGRPGNNPYCHHRVLELGERGLRERVVQIAPAPGLPFDHGTYGLVLEKLDGAPVDAPPSEYVRPPRRGLRIVS